MRRRSGLDIPETIEDACDPATMALIVYDMQVGVLRQLPDGAETLERVSGVLTAARAGGYPVFYTRHMSLPPKLMGTAQLRTAMAGQHVDDPEKVQSWFLRGTPGFQIVADLSPRADEAVFDKLAMSAFAGTPMEMALRNPRYRLLRHRRRRPGDRHRADHLACGRPLRVSHDRPADDMTVRQVGGTPSEET